MRQAGWEARLLAVVAAAQHEPYRLGTHDCFRLACRVVEALTGVDRWPQFAGQYATKREALRLIARFGLTFESAFDWFFALPHTSPKVARRGDIAAYADPEGEKHLGIVLGAETAVLGPHGLLRVPTLQCLAAWRID
jgi:hypothetical protein